MREVEFAAVGQGEFFREVLGGAWLMKTDETTARWNGNGVEAIPTFAATEMVWVKGMEGGTKMPEPHPRTTRQGE